MSCILLWSTNQCYLNLWYWYYPLQQPATCPHVGLWSICWNCTFGDFVMVYSWSRRLWFKLLKEVTKSLTTIFTSWPCSIYSLTVFPQIQSGKKKKKKERKNLSFCSIHAARNTVRGSSPDGPRAQADDTVLKHCHRFQTPVNLLQIFSAFDGMFHNVAYFASSMVWDKPQLAGTTFRSFAFPLLSQLATITSVNFTPHAFCWTRLLLGDLSVVMEVTGSTEELHDI